MEGSPLQSFDASCVMFAFLGDAARSCPIPSQLNHAWIDKCPEEPMLIGDISWWPLGDTTVPNSYTVDISDLIHGLAHLKFWANLLEFYRSLRFLNVFKSVFIVLTHYLRMCYSPHHYVGLNFLFHIRRPPPPPPLPPLPPPPPPRPLPPPPPPLLRLLRLPPPVACLYQLVSINFSISTCLYQLVSINLSPSTCLSPIVSINLSVSTSLPQLGAALGATIAGPLPRLSPGTPLDAAGVWQRSVAAIVAGDAARRRGGLAWQAGY